MSQGIGNGWCVRLRDQGRSASCRFYVDKLGFASERCGATGDYRLGLTVSAPPEQPSFQLGLFTLVPRSALTIDALHRAFRCGHRGQRRECHPLVLLNR